MKAIDLYIATEKNEKVPDIVFYNFYKYRYYPNENNYYREKNCDLISLFLDAKPDDIIYLPEDTPKEDKKIEKLETYKDLNSEIYLDNYCYKYMPIHKDSLSFNEQVIVDKLNEIIKVINGE